MYKAPRPPQTSDSNKPIFNSNPQTLRLYQVWKGNNRFYCGGRLIFGPDVRSIFLTVFLILTPVILFCAFVSQTLINEFQHKLGYLIVTVCAVFTVYVLFLLFLTSGSDPGIIPRNSDPLDLDDDGSTISSDWMGTQRLGPSLPPTKDVIVNGMIIKVKYCQTCMLYRPPRCSHCSICNNCVERFDHHCPWVGQCIGKRNYRFFFMFVSSTTMLCLYVFTFCCVNVSKLMHAYNCTLWRALAKSPVSGILILYTFITVWFVGGLTAFHFYLILTNQTTYENFRYRYHRKMNPYNHGRIRNVLEIFCSKIASSKNNFREKVKVDPSAIFAKSLSLRHSVSPEVRKKNFDIETGKQQVVTVEDFEGMHTQHISVGTLERCQTEPRHRSWDHKTDWENTPDVHMLAAEYGMEHGLADRKKTRGVR